MSNMPKELLENHTVTNPLDVPVKFKYDGNVFVIPAYSVVNFVGYVAKHAAKHVAKAILRTHKKYSLCQDILNEQTGVRKEGKGVHSSQELALASALMDFDGGKLNLNLLIQDALTVSADTEKMKEEEAEVVQPIGNVIVEDSEEVEEVITSSSTEEEVSVTAEEAEFARLKGIGFAKLKGEDRARYQELKAKLV